MKSIPLYIAFALIAFSALTLSGQNFEGRIVYSNTYSNNVSNSGRSQGLQITDEHWQNSNGSIHEFYIKDGNYKIVANSTMNEWRLYVNSENRLYSKLPHQQTAMWADAFINVDSILSVEVNQKVDNILGYDCDEVILNCKSGIQKYYFNRSLKVDATLFKNHKSQNWYTFLKQSNSLPLKIVKNTPWYTVESIATEVTEMKINDIDLQLPKNIKTSKIEVFISY